MLETKRCLSVCLSVCLISCAGPERTPLPVAKKTSALFAALTCPTSNPEVYGLEISTKKWQALRIQNKDEYENNTWRPWRMLFNKNVEYVGYRFYSFDVEFFYDHLDITGSAGPIRYTGTEPLIHPDFPPLGQFLGPAHTLGGGSNTAYLDFEWYVDSSVRKTGYKIDALQLHCRQTPAERANDHELLQNYPYDGYFLGSRDVIYVKVKQPAGYKMGLLLWPIADADFDIYASTTDTFPDSSATWTGVRAGRAPELVIIPKWGQAGGGDRWIYIAIGSWSGKGQFRFYANVHGTLNSGPRRASTDWTPTTATKAHIRDMLHKMSVATYLATEGRFLIESWKIEWNSIVEDGGFRFWRNFTGASACNRSMSGACTGGLGDSIDLNTSNWCGCQPADSPTCVTCDNTKRFVEERTSHKLLHEFGHCDNAFGLPNEYNSTGACGHSVMAQPGAYEANVTDFCVWYNGGWDPWAGDTGHTMAENNWSCFATKLYKGGAPVPEVPALYTPDAFYQLRLAGQPDGSTDFRNRITITETQH